MQEFQLYHQWQALAGSKKDLVNGRHHLQILESGELQTARGPDFRSARFILNGVTYQGDVECHVTTADWYRHQHHLDPAYSNVLLHVVAFIDTHPRPVMHQQRAQNIPTIALPAEMATLSRNVCQAGIEAVADFQELGIESMHQKSTRLEHLLQTFSSEHLFYDLGLQVLGYGCNENGFRLLAERLPWSWFHHFVHKLPQQSMEAICLGQAGLLSEATEYSEKLMFLFRQARPKLEFNSLPNDIWRYSGIRPFNYPDFRLAGWTQLYYMHTSPFSSLNYILSQRLPLNKVRGEIKHFFSIPCSDFWQTHYRLDAQAHKQRISTYFGKARIAEFLINLVIPLAYAMARKNKSTGFMEYLESFYSHIRLPGLYSQVKKRFPFLANNHRAVVVQGMLFARRTYCSEGSCAKCPIFREKH